MAILRSWPLTAFGLLTRAVVLVAEAVQGAGTPVGALYDVLRVIVVPIWLMRYVVVAIGGLLFGFREALAY